MPDIGIPLRGLQCDAKTRSEDPVSVGADCAALEPPTLASPCGDFNVTRKRDLNGLVLVGADPPSGTMRAALKPARTKNETS